MAVKSVLPDTRVNARLMSDLRSIERPKWTQNGSLVKRTTKKHYLPRHPYYYSSKELFGITRFLLFKIFFKYCLIICIRDLQSVARKLPRKNPTSLATLVPSSAFVCFFDVIVSNPFNKADLTDLLKIFPLFLPRPHLTTKKFFHSLQSWLKSLNFFYN